MVIFLAQWFLLLPGFVLPSSMGLAGLRTTDNAVLFEKPLVVVYFDIDYERNPKGSNYWRNRYINTLAISFHKQRGSTSIL